MVPKLMLPEWAEAYADVPAANAVVQKVNESPPAHVPVKNGVVTFHRWRNRDYLHCPGSKSADMVLVPTCTTYTSIYDRS